MSRAFIKETDDQWLDQIPPTIKSLINYLTRENNGIGVYEKSVSVHPATGQTIHKMSNGFSYTIEDSKWTMIEE